MINQNKSINLIQKTVKHAIALTIAITSINSYANLKYAIITGANTELQDATLKNIGLSFLKQRSLYSTNGTLITPIENGSSQAQQAFYKESLNMTLSDVNDYWRHQIFSGGEIQPKKIRDNKDLGLSSDQIIARYIQNNPSSISYISWNTYQNTVKNKPNAISLVMSFDQDQVIKPIIKQSKANTTELTPHRYKPKTKSASTPQDDELAKAQAELKQQQKLAAKEKEEAQEAVEKAKEQAQKAEEQAKEEQIQAQARAKAVAAEKAKIAKQQAEEKARAEARARAKAIAAEKARIAKQQAEEKAQAIAKEQARIKKSQAEARARAQAIAAEKARIAKQQAEEKAQAAERAKAIAKAKAEAEAASKARQIANEKAKEEAIELQKIKDQVRQAQEQAIKAQEQAAEKIKQAQQRQIAAEKKAKLAQQRSKALQDKIKENTNRYSNPQETFKQYQDAGPVISVVDQPNNNTNFNNTNNSDNSNQGPIVTVVPGPQSQR